MKFRLPSPHSAAWVIAETATGAVFSLFSLLLIGRVIGPQAAGTGAVAIAAFLLLDLASGSLFNDAVVQRPKLSPAHAGSAVTAQVLLGLAGAALLALLAPLLASQTQAPEVLGLCWALAPLLPVSAFAGATSGLVLRQQRYRLLALRAMLGLPVGLVAGLLVADAGGGAWAMVAFQAGATLSIALLFLLRGRLALRAMLSRQALADLWPVAGPQVLSVVVQAGRYRLFVLALGFLTAEAVVAVCNIAFRLLDSALGMVWGSTARLALPRFAALQHSPGALATAYGEVAQLQALMGMPIAAGVALCAPELVLALLGPAWVEAAGAARVAGWVAVLSFAWGDASSLYVALGRTRRNLVLAMVALLVPLLTLMVVRPQGAIGVAACWAAGSLAIAPLNLWLVLRTLRRSPWWLMQQIAPALAATAAMVLVVELLRLAVNHGPPLARLLVAALPGAALFGLVAWLALGRRMPAALRRAMVARAGH